MKLACDFDGTLAQPSLSEAVYENRWSHSFLWCLAASLVLVLISPLYLLRSLNRGASQEVSDCKRQEGSVVIFSATVEFLLNRQLMRAWLWLHGVSYDKLILRPRRESVREFKARTLIEEDCTHYLEDSEGVFCGVVIALIRQRVNCVTRDGPAGLIWATLHPWG